MLTQGSRDGIAARVSRNASAGEPKRKPDNPANASARVSGEALTSKKFLEGEPKREPSRECPPARWSPATRRRTRGTTPLGPLKPVPDAQPRRQAPAEAPLVYMILEAEGDIEVVGEARDGAQALVVTRQLRPDVVLMDVQMPRMDGLKATGHIVGDGATRSRVVILTTFERDDYVFEALRAGASGFLLENAPTEELVHAVRVVAAGRGATRPTSPGSPTASERCCSCWQPVRATRSWRAIST